VTSVEQLLGNIRDDSLTGSSGEDELFGGGGDDRLSGGAGDDLLVDGAGDDVLRGGSGDDFLHHEGGRDNADCGGARRDRLLISTSTPVRVKRCERSDVLGGYDDGKYDDSRVAGTVRLDSIRRSRDVLEFRAVCAERADCGVRVSLQANKRFLSADDARSGNVRLPLDRHARRIVRARRSLQMTVEFRDGNLNYGGKANYVLDPP
jgi:hypothetical protein